MRSRFLSGGAVLLAGTLLAGAAAAQPEPPAPRPPAALADEPTAPKPRVIGPILPPLTLSTRTDVWWTAPSAPLTVALGAGAASGTRSTQVVGRWLAQGSLGDFSLDVLLQTPEAPHREEPPDRNGPRGATGTNQWAGMRIPIAEADEQLVVFGVYGRAGIPVTPDGRARSDLGIALGGLAGSWSWLFNFGSRQRHGKYTQSAPDLWNPYVLLGPTWSITDQLRVYGAGSFQGLLVGLFASGADSAEDNAYMDWAGHAHLGAEVSVGSILLGPSLMLTPLARPREPHASVQLWLGYVP